MQLPGGGAIVGAGAQRAGKNSRLSVGGTPMVFKKFDVEMHGKDIETVSMESAGTIGTVTGGIEEGIIGTVGCAISFDGDWNAKVTGGTNFIDPNNPPGIYPRDDLPNVRCICNVTDVVFWSFAYMRVRSSKNGTAVDGAVSFSASGMNQGIWGLPAG